MEVDVVEVPKGRHDQWLRWGAWRRNDVATTIAKCRPLGVTFKKRVRGMDASARQTSHSARTSLTGPKTTIISTVVFSSIAGNIQAM